MPSSSSSSRNNNSNEKKNPILPFLISYVLSGLLVVTTYYYGLKYLADNFPGPPNCNGEKCYCNSVENPGDVSLIDAKHCQSGMAYLWGDLYRDGNVLFYFYIFGMLSGAVGYIVNLCYLVFGSNSTGSGGSGSCFLDFVLYKLDNESYINLCTVLFLFMLSSMFYMPLVVSYIAAGTAGAVLGTGGSTSQKNDYSYLYWLMRFQLFFTGVCGITWAYLNWVALDKCSRTNGNDGNAKKDDDIGYGTSNSSDNNNINSDRNSNSTKEKLIANKDNDHHHHHHHKSSFFLVCAKLGPCLLATHCMLLDGLTYSAYVWEFTPNLVVNGGQ